MKETGKTLSEAAWYWQVERSGEPFKSGFSYPLRWYPPLYEEGLALLQPYDASLRLFFPPQETYGKALDI